MWQTQQESSNIKSSNTNGISNINKSSGTSIDSNRNNCNIVNIGS
jgi:hypothetical protein